MNDKTTIQNQIDMLEDANPKLKAPQYLSKWKRHLSADDYDFIINYVENINRGRPNNRMIVLYDHEEKTEATKELIRNMKKYIADPIGTMYRQADLENLLYEKYIQNRLIYVKPTPSCINFIINLIVYNQSMITTINTPDEIRNIFRLDQRQHPTDYIKMIVLNPLTPVQQN